MSKVDLAPIALFVYRRPIHLKRVIESLLRNEESSCSELYIFSDGAKNQEDMLAVEAVRAYISEIRGFKKVNLVIRSENFGLANSIIAGVTELVRLNERVIVLEDDIVVGKYFLRYMNDGLQKYNSVSQVACIHGWNYPLGKSNIETFFLKGGDCWGWATWKRSWAFFETDGEKLLREIESSNLIKEFDLDNAYPYTQMLRDQILGKNNSWAIRWHASLFLKNKLTLHPYTSQVVNIGLDGSGTHCANLEDILPQNQEIDRKIELFSETISESKAVKALIIDHLKSQKGEEKEEFRNNWLLHRIKRILRPLKVWLRILFRSFGLIKTTEGNFIEKEFEWFSGNYATWDDATKQCEGYDNNNILIKVLESARLVRDGKAVFERDSALFDKVQYSLPLLANLLYSVNALENKLRLVDFGGSLGTTYYQNFEFLKNLKELSWNIVEQQDFVRYGRAEFSNEHMHFFESFDKVFEVQKIDVVLFSSSIQYISDPFKLLKDLQKFEFRFLLFDRTPFFKNHSLSHRIAIQHVPREIYEANYPAWFFNEKEFFSQLEDHFIPLFVFDSFESWNIESHFVQNKCILFERR